MTDDRELEGWKEEWNKLGDRDALAEELTARVEADRRGLRRQWAIEVSSVPVSVAICVWLLVRTRGQLLSTVACAAMLVLAGVWITRFVMLRQGTLENSTRSLDAFIDLTRRRLDDDLRWVRFSRRTLQVAVALVSVWCVVVVVVHFDRYATEPWRALVGFGVAAVVLVGSFVWSYRKERTIQGERARFEALVAERTIS